MVEGQNRLNLACISQRVQRLWSEQARLERRQAEEAAEEVAEEAAELDVSPTVSEGQQFDSPPSSAHWQVSTSTSTVVRAHPWTGDRVETVCFWDISCPDSPSPITKRLSFPPSFDGENGGLTHLQTYASQVLLHLTVVFEFSRLNLPCLEI